MKSKLLIFIALIAITMTSCLEKEDYYAEPDFDTEYGEELTDDEDYAATNPGEDIAEVFAFFITETEPRTGSSIADQKVNLLYEFEELLELRAEMRQSEPMLDMQAGSWLTNPLRKQFRVRKH